MVKIRNSLVENNKKQGRTNRILSGMIFIVVMILALLIVLNTVVFMTIEVDGSSMYPTLYNGDVLKVLSQWKGIPSVLKTGLFILTAKF